MQIVRTIGLALFWGLVTTGTAKAERWDLDVAIEVGQITRPSAATVADRLTHDEFRTIIIDAATPYFRTAKAFSPDQTANTFILANLHYLPKGYKHGLITASKDLFCVTLKSEMGGSDGRGSDNCKTSIRRAIRSAFSDLRSYLGDTYNEIEQNQTRYDWLTFLDTGQLLGSDGANVRYAYGRSYNPLRFEGFTLQSTQQRSPIEAKNNIRDMVSIYFQDENTTQTIEIFDSTDLLFVFLTTPENVKKHADLVARLVSDTPGSYRLWPALIHHAIANGAPEDVVRDILGKRPKCDSMTDAIGNTPLMRAIAHERYGLAQMFIDQGCSVRAENAIGHQVVHVATMASVLEGDFSFIDLAINNGADINAVAGEGFTPLGTAIYANKLSENSIRGDRLVAGFLARGSHIENFAEDGTPLLSALQIAVSSGDADIVKALLDAGTNPNPSLAQLPSVIQMAVEEGNPQIIELLLKAGSDPDATTAADQTRALDAAYPDPTQAISSTDRRVIDLLLDYGADNTYTDASGYTAYQRYEGRRRAYLAEQARLAEQRVREEAERRRRAAEAERRRRLEARQRRNDWFDTAATILQGVTLGLNEYNAQVQREQYRAEQRRRDEFLRQQNSRSYPSTSSSSSRSSSGSSGNITITVTKDDSVDAQREAERQEAIRRQEVERQRRNEEAQREREAREAERAAERARREREFRANAPAHCKAYYANLGKPCPQGQSCVTPEDC